MLKLDYGNKEHLEGKEYLLTQTLIITGEDEEDMDFVSTIVPTVMELITRANRRRGAFASAKILRAKDPNLGKVEMIKVLYHFERFLRDARTTAQDILDGKQPVIPLVKEFVPAPDGSGLNTEYHTKDWETRWQVLCDNFEFLLLPPDALPPLKYGEE